MHPTLASAAAWQAPLRHSAAAEVGRGLLLAVLALFEGRGRAEGRPAPPREAGTEPAAPVLLVDDVAANRRLMAVMLARMGRATEEAADATAALALLGTGRFAAVLMDVEMPGMDGLEATRRIRAMPGPVAGVPVFAVTAHDGAEERQAAAAAGFDGYLVKPVSMADLSAALAAAARREPAETA